MSDVACFWNKSNRDQFFVKAGPNDLPAVFEKLKTAGYTHYIYSPITDDLIANEVRFAEDLGSRPLWADIEGTNIISTPWIMSPTVPATLDEIVDVVLKRRPAEAKGENQST